MDIGEKQLKIVVEVVEVAGEEKKVNPRSAREPVDLDGRLQILLLMLMGYLLKLVKLFRISSLLQACIEGCWFLLCYKEESSYVEEVTSAEEAGVCTIS